MSNTVVAMQPSKNGFLMEPQSLNEAMELANMLANSNLVPKSYQGKPGDVLVACQWGSEIGLKPLQALQNIAVINNVPAVWGDALVALVRGSGLCEYIDQDWDPQTKTATCRVKRKGEPEQIRTFSEEDARVAGHLNKQTYKQNLPRMCSIRARAFALRDVFADVLKGLKVAEEVEDYPAEREINPAPAGDAKPASRTSAVLDRVRRHKPQQEESPAPTTIDQHDGPVTQAEQPEPGASESEIFDGFAKGLETATDIQQLQGVWNQAYHWAEQTGNQQILSDLTSIKDERKQALSL